MKSFIILFLALLMFLQTSCSHLDQTAKARNSKNAHESNTPNQFGWSQSNCAHIMADGHCAAPLAPNSMDTFHNAAAPHSSEPFENSTPPPNPNGWNSTNCAHITADGNCLQPL